MADAQLSIPERLAGVLERVAEAAKKAGRAATEITLVAVSKTHPPETVREALEAGQLIFGESKVQEARAKIPLLPARAQWHFIGHLQTNKIRHALPLFELIHSVDSLELARELDRIAGETGARPRVLLELNVAGEASKFGFAPAALEEGVESLLSLERLQIEGLMCVPPPVPKPEEARRFFVLLREMAGRLEQAAGVPFQELSMGMSHDFEVAIEEGATMVRVGSAIFGPRAAKARAARESAGEASPA